MKNILSLLFVFSSIYLSAQITLTHNVGNVPIDTGMPNCEDEEYWARTFTLSDFGITTEEQFVITSGQVAIRNAYNGAQIGINIYSIDSNFPNSNPGFIGGAITYTNEIGDTPEIVQINFNPTIVIPASVERILVVASQGTDIYNPNFKKAIIAGTQMDNGVSWFSGCRKYYTYTSTLDLEVPVPDANFFINVTGEKFNNTITGPNITLNHNISDPPIEMNQYSCTGGGLKFARTFVLEDFGISNNEEYVIDTGEVAFSSVGVWDVKIQFNVYKIDDNFPDSFSINDLLGSSQVVDIPYFGTNNPSRIFKVDFDNPVLVPSNVDRVLVEVYNLARPGYSSTAFIAGTEKSNDLSWIKSENGGCPPECYSTTVDIGRPDVNYYINVTGKVNASPNQFGIRVTSICTEYLKEFSVEDRSEVASVIWDFGDISSGASNISSDMFPSHEFSNSGEYTVTATVTGVNGNTEVLTQKIIVNPAKAFAISNIYACEDTFNSGFSSSFDTSLIEQQVLGGQLDKIVTFYDENGNKLYNLSNPFYNSIKDKETITVRVADVVNRCCYSETSFDLVVLKLPDISGVNDIYECNNNNDGFTAFNLSEAQFNLENSHPNSLVQFFHEDGEQISNSNVNAVVNRVENEETITVRVTNNDTNCYNETTFKLIVNLLPIANTITDLIGCDDNNDGISEYFDTANVESSVLGNQNGMAVTYYNSAGNEISLSNPFTNSTPNQETITVRVTNPATNCYAETPLVLNTSNKPQINTPQDIYACDEGDGYATFNLASIENEIIGNQANLKIYYFNDNGSDITNTITSNFKNTVSWNQTISVKVENMLSNLCVSETSFKLIVNELPQVSLENEYFLCNLEPSLEVDVDSGLDSYEWFFEDGTLVSTSNKAILTNSGNYSLKITKINNGISCENIYDFKLIRSVLPKIENVEFQELSDNNFIKINASGDGDFQYSIDGNIYQNSNTFYNVLGGVYTVYVIDRLGCGNDSKEITIINYPKYFTPNNDGNNDFWHIKGVANYPNAIVNIYDRYGKLLKQINANSSGWDGTFDGNYMPNSDYWFTVFLNEEKSFTGHFALKR